jgi:hypothetical protein
VKKPVVFGGLTRAERWILLLAVMTFVNAMVPWWFRVRTSQGNVFTFNAGLTGWGTVVAGCAAVAAVLVIARAWVWPHPVPRLDGLLYTTLGVLSLVSTLILIGERGASWYGLYAGLALSLGLTAAGLARRTERAAGWT